MNFKEKLYKQLSNFVDKIDDAAKENFDDNNPLTFKICFEFKPHTVWNKIGATHYDISIEENMPCLISGEYISDAGKLERLLR